MMPSSTPNRLALRPGKLPACNPCRAIKLRCDHRKPICSRCRERGLEDDCIYRPRPFKRPSGKDIVHRHRLGTDQTSLSPPLPSPLPTENEAGATAPGIEAVGPFTSFRVSSSVQYPNPGYLGSSSHTTFFDQLQVRQTPEDGAGVREDLPSVPLQRDCAVEENSIAKGAEILLELYQGNLVQQFTQLFSRWTATGANLALAGPLTSLCASTIVFTLAQCDGTHASAVTISQGLFSRSCQPVSFAPDTKFTEYCANFCGRNARWETLGLFLTAVCRASVDLTYAEPMYGSEQRRRQIQKLTLSYSDRLLDLCLPLDCMNDLQLFLTYENFISHSQVDGDQSYLSWRKLGDVAASLFALGHHQQQTESFQTVPSFLRQLRQTAFCRTYSADKNVSIFLGRPPRILRKFCHFYLPGDPEQAGPPQAASRKPAVWDSSTEQIDYITDSRWAGLCAILKEDILDLFNEENYEERVRRARIIEADAHAQWHAVPPSCRLEGNLKSCDRRPVERDFMVNMKLNYIHVQFLLQLALRRPTTMMDPDPNLLTLSLQMLGLVVEAILLKDQIVNSGTSLVWKVAYYGLSAAGLISMTLVNRGFAPIALPSGGISKVFQELSILVGEIERGTLVYIDSPNYALLSRATQTIKSILDRSMSFQPLQPGTATVSGEQLNMITAPEQPEAFDDGSWGLWDHMNLQEFEINFWHQLAGHPSLN
ncbi:hypothetical protein ASPACDRAFT_1908912 [Aspergillus aculeatus ATCC 16872]|uniref:Zn(2)-C6 fungal-type domain-containing protein n=1 Tax=Aspergillus aculeatus (strain ATCC 16872 / CBS 172.66 / WB 5094) TaxID=690307 RepID=A0A1L9WET3_ASPA1|nr:uncharacterized protein ASPACDRAFT_1908912 [Aspergillus aculeatus ATCC 16872]OJJ94663.1 hypothetical protein ASPACDRAFT_1908912 [Aspergillus aculeatus ATCC 16872]